MHQLDELVVRSRAIGRNDLQELLFESTLSPRQAFGHGTGDVMVTQYLVAVLHGLTLEDVVRDSERSFAIHPLGRSIEFAVTQVKRRTTTNLIEDHYYQLSMCRCG